ncbi:MAG: hypothetical protein WA484_09620 [Solirubrobacteraceae bacterium]
MLIALAVLGVACVIAAIVGGNVKVMAWLSIGGELTKPRQWSLGILGIVLIVPLVASLALGTRHPSPSAEKPAQATHPGTETPDGGSDTASQQARQRQRGAEQRQKGIEAEQPSQKAPASHAYTATSAHSQIRSSLPQRASRRGKAGRPPAATSGDASLRQSAVVAGAPTSQGVQPAGQSAAATGRRITRAIFGGSPSEPEVIIEGTGLGAVPATTNDPAYSGYTGADYGNSLYLCDTSTNPKTFCAGQNDGGGHGWDTIGLVVAWSGETSIQLKLGSIYASYYYPSHTYELQQGDGFAMHTAGATCTGSVSYGQSVTCE